MDFQVNERTYFLGMDEDDRRWQLFVSEPGGAREIPVYEDAPELPALVVLQEDKRRLLN
jgi:hypothetical protein